MGTNERVHINLQIDEKMLDPKKYIISLEIESMIK